MDRGDVSCHDQPSYSNNRWKSGHWPDIGIEPGAAWAAGENTNEVLGTWGVSKDRIKKLHASGALS
jgi:crotonobetainyl-CoA:carnitine CoA-transferase CaiB-like acyl-CoA transferase